MAHLHVRSESRYVFAASNYMYIVSQVSFKIESISTPTALEITKMLYTDQVNNSVAVDLVMGIQLHSAYKWLLYSEL